MRKSDFALNSFALFVITVLKIASQRKLLAPAGPGPSRSSAAAPYNRTGAWENLKKALRAEYEETVWDHLAGAESAPFERGEHGQVAVKVIGDRWNELLVVKSLREATG